MYLQRNRATTIFVVFLFATRSYHGGAQKRKRKNQNGHVVVDSEDYQAGIVLKEWFLPSEVDIVIESFCARVDLDRREICHEQTRIEAYAQMRAAQKSRSFKVFGDRYNDGVHQILQGNVSGALHIWYELLTRRRGVPFNAYAERSGPDDRTRGEVFDAYVRERSEGIVESAAALLDRAWSLGECEKMNKVPNAYLPHPYSIEAKGSSFVTSIEKMTHDCEQIELLVSRRILPKNAIRIVESARGILRSLSDDITDYFILTPDAFRSVGSVFQTLLYHPLPTQLPSDAFDVDVLGENVDWAAVERAYFHESEVVSADGVLSPNTLRELLTFCEEATIFFDVKPGYLGAYMNEGYAHPLLVRVAEALRKKMPRLLGPHALTQMWAYKYTSVGGRGIKVHADPAKVNLNLWLTSDDARVPEGGGGGLVVYLKEPPSSWSPRQANDFNFEKDIMAFVGDAPRRTFEYKQNRFVMFNSKLFHKTDAFRFRDCYTCRRINLTFLFGSA
eukprot:g2823.t1